MGLAISKNYKEFIAKKHPVILKKVRLSKKPFLYAIFCYFWTTNFLLNPLNINFSKQTP
jgi:hypothetical protein